MLGYDGPARRPWSTEDFRAVIKECLVLGHSGFGTVQCVTFVVVTGQPGSGKSTLAGPLARRLRMSLLAKDTIKEALAVLADPEGITASRSRELGAASFDVIFALASQSGGAILEASWDPMLAAERLTKLPGALIEVHCQCPPQVARRRYIERADRRHWVHLDATRAHDDELWAAPGPHGLSDPVIVVDTTTPLDLEAVVSELTDHSGWSQQPLPEA